MEVLKLVQLVGRPAGTAAPMEERYVYPASRAETVWDAQCQGHCHYRSLVVRGEAAGHPGTTAWP